MLRYRFGFPGIFFLFNVWWGDKFNRQNQSIIYFAIEIRFINFRYWSYYLTRTQGKPVENWGGKFLWSEVAIFDVWVFLSDPLFDIPSYFDQKGYSIPEFFLITPVIWLWTLSSLTRQPFHFCQFQPRFLLFQEDVLSVCLPFKSCVILAQFLKSLNVNRKM